MHVLEATRMEKINMSPESLDMRVKSTFCQCQSAPNMIRLYYQEE